MAAQMNVDLAEWLAGARHRELFEQFDLIEVFAEAVQLRRLIQADEHTVLVDCGAGTQMQIDSFKIRRGKINHIFISHLHGDHYFGLIGLLTSLGLNNRINDLHIYAPKNLQAIINIQIEAAGGRLSYALYFHELENEGIIFSDKKITVQCFKVNHRIECWGFKFQEKKNRRRIDIKQAKKNKIPNSF